MTLLDNNKVFASEYNDYLKNEDIIVIYRLIRKQFEFLRKKYFIFFA